MSVVRWISRHGAGLLTVFFGIIFLFSVVPPLIFAKYPSVAIIVKYILSPLCHQNPERSFHIAGCQLGLCARCTGIFLGLTVFGLTASIIKPKKGISFFAMFVLLAPLAIDGTAQTFGLWDTGNVPRFLTGIAASIGIVFFIYPIILFVNKNDFRDKPEDKP